MKPLIVVQARLSSTRLPKKVLKDIRGQTMVARVLQRARLAPWPVVPAWPHQEDEEQDVILRFVRLLRNWPKVTHVTRITSDCPLLDHAIVEHVITLMSRSPQCEIVSTHPDMDGLDAECFTVGALHDADRWARGSDREHVTPWMKRRLCGEVINWAPKPLRWSVDDEEGLEFVRMVYAACEWCAEGIPHHTNAGGSIGGGDRHLVMDLHHMPDGGLAECQAAPVLRTRMGGEAYHGKP